MPLAYVWLPDHAHPPGLQTTAPTHAVPEHPSPGCHPGRREFAGQPRASLCSHRSIAELQSLWLTCNGFNRLRALRLQSWGDKADTRRACWHRCTLIAKISPSSSSPSHPPELVITLAGSKQAGAPIAEAGGHPAPLVVTAPRVLEALASSNHGYARQQLDRVRVLHAEN